MQVKHASKTCYFVTRAVNVPKLFHILGRFGAPFFVVPRCSRGNGAYVTPLILECQWTKNIFQNTSTSFHVTFLIQQLSQIVNHLYHLIMM